MPYYLLYLLDTFIYSLSHRYTEYKKMTNRITEQNRQFYLDILRDQTGLDLKIRSNGYGYALELDGQDVSRNGLTGTTVYEVVYAMTRLLSEMKKQGLLNESEIELLANKEEIEQ